MKWEMSSKNSRSCRGWSTLSWLICGKWFYWTSEQRHHYLLPNFVRYLLISRCAFAESSLESSARTFVVLGFFDLIIKQNCCTVTSKYCLIRVLQFLLSLRSVFSWSIVITHAEEWGLMSSHLHTSPPFTVGQKLWVHSITSLVTHWLTFRTCTKHCLPKITGSKTGSLAAGFLSSQLSTCELEKDRCYFSHQIDFNRVGANLVICPQSHYHNLRFRKWWRDLHYLLLLLFSCAWRSLCGSLILLYKAIALRANSWS